MDNKINNMDRFNNDKKIILDHFSETIKKHRIGPKAVSWGSEDSQKIRFRVLSEIGDLNGKTILDVGCGLGDFYGFLVNEKKLKLRKYLGIDINPLMIIGAKKKYPGVEFRVGDLTGVLPKESFDYVFESGIFNLKIPHWEKFVYKVLTQMYEVSKVGVGANFLSIFSPFTKDKNSYYADTCEVLRFVFTKLTTKAIFRHDYKPNDFTIFFYKDFLKK